MKRSKLKRIYKVMTTKIRIVIRSFDHPNHESCISCYNRLILIKKSREQFEMEIKIKYQVIKT